MCTHNLHVHESLHDLLLIRVNRDRLCLRQNTPQRLQLRFTHVENLRIITSTRDTVVGVGVGVGVGMRDSVVVVVVVVAVVMNYSNNRNDDHFHFCYGVISATTTAACHYTC